MVNVEWLDSKLLSRVEEYCKENGFDFAEHVNTYIRDGFTRERFGEVPPFFAKEERKPEEKLPLVINRYTIKVEPKRKVPVQKPNDVPDDSGEVSSNAEHEPKPKSSRRKLNVK